MSRCVDVPVSHLRLEQLAVGDLPASAAGQIRGHLEDCPACRACLEAIEGDQRVLRPLELQAEVPQPFFSPARLRWLLGGGALVAAAAALLFVVLGPGGGADVPGTRVAIKGGGEMVLSVIRERDGHVERNATQFREGDRLKVALTCTVAGDVSLDIAVFQGRDVFRPLGAPSIRCGNNSIVPGAFSVTGSRAITVCVEPNPSGKRLSLRHRDNAACFVLSAER